MQGGKSGFPLKRKKAGGARVCNSRMAGFSLLELSIALIILGLVAVPIIQLYKTSLKAMALSETRGAQNQVILAINQFYENGAARYPCPASLTVAEGDSAYGVEGDCTTPFPLCSSGTWMATDGICQTSNAADAVVIGAVPFNTLKIGAELSTDFWDNRMFYAVTHAQTALATFSADPGRVTVQTVATGVPATYCEGGGTDCYTDVDFVLASTGRTGYGGFTNAGNHISSCPTPANGREAENCNMDAVFLLDRVPNNNMLGTRSDAVGPTFFDDILAFQRQVPRNTWYPTPSGGGSHVISEADRVGVGTTNPQHALDVNGSVQADSVRSNSICNGDCLAQFQPEIIVDDMPQMQCGDQPMVRVGGSQVHCAKAGAASTVTVALPNAFPTATCSGTTPLVKGFNASGGIICTAP